jgi:hypothetical protein
VFMGTPSRGQLGGVGMPQAVWVDPFRDPSLRVVVTHHGADVGLVERASLEGAVGVARAALSATLLHIHMRGRA